MLSFRCDDSNHLVVFWATSTSVTWWEFRAPRRFLKRFWPTLFPLVRQSSVSTALEEMCYSPIVELLHPASCSLPCFCSVFWKYSQEKQRALNFCYCIWEWPFHLLLLDIPLKDYLFWQQWAICWVVLWVKKWLTALWHPLTGQCPCPKVWYPSPAGTVLCHL